MGIFSIFKKNFVLSKLMNEYCNYIVNLQMGNFSGNEQRDLDNQLFNLVMNDSDLVEVLEKYNINETQLRRAFRMLVMVGAGQIKRGAYVPAASIATLPTLTYICKKINQNPELLNIKNEESIGAEPAIEEEWLTIAYSLLKYYETRSMGQVKEL